MKLLEFYKSLQSILECYHIGDLEQDEAEEQIRELTAIAKESGLEVSVKEDIVGSIEVYSSYEENSYDEDIDDKDGDN